MASYHNLPSLPAIGELAAGRYRILREIGRGGYGVVYQAHQEAIDREVAIKILLPEVASNEKEVERFRREVFHASGLSSPHTITLFDYGRSPEGLFFVAMEFLEGVNLRAWLSDHRKMEARHGRRLLEQALHSLEEAHSRQLVHRDLKPENIFIGRFPETALDIRLLDFGLSKFIGDPRSTLYRGPSLTAEGEVCGTPQYMSPEHAYGEAVGPPSDIYSLGLVLYEVLVGKPAFDGASPLDILLKQVKSPLPALPPELEKSPLGKFILRATEKEADQRFRHAGEVLEWLCQFPEDGVAISATNMITSSDRKAESKTPISEAQSPSFTPEAPAVGESNTVQLYSAPPENTANSEEIEETEENEEIHLITKEQLSTFELRLAQLPLLGRRKALAHLDAWFAQSTNAGGLFGLTGDAGVGKTILLETWTTRVETLEGITILRGKYPKNPSPLEGLRQALLTLAPSEAPTSYETIRLSNEDFHFLTTELLDPEQSARQRGQDAVASLQPLLDNLAMDGPVLLVLENIQNADRLTLAFLDRLVDSLIEKPRPISIVLSARRPAQVQGWTKSARGTFDEQHLLPLDREDTRRILGQLLPASEELGRDIVELSSGNPALLIHVCRYLLESSLLTFDKSRNHFVLSSTGTSIEDLVPLDLQQVVIERANRHLAASENEAHLRSILHRSVLLGERFHGRLLAEILRREGLLELCSQASALLEELARCGLLRSEKHEGERLYSFARSLHRLSLVRMVESIDDWRTFHRVAAAAFQDFYGNNPDYVAVQIAEHLEKAQLVDEALSWWLRAARVAESHQNLYEALQYLRRAEYSLKRVVSLDPEQAGSMRLQQGRLFRQAGEFGPAEDALREAVAYARASDNSDLLARALEYLAESILLQGRLDEAEAMLLEASNLYQILVDLRGRRRAQLALAILCNYQGQYHKARQLFESLREEGIRRGDEAVEVGSMLGLSRCHFASGELREAAQLLDEALLKADQYADPRSAALANLEAAHVHLLLTSVEAAEGFAHRALLLARQINDVLIEANAHLALGIALRRSTHLDRASFHARRARELHESLGHIYGLLKSVLLQAELRWAKGDPLGARALAKDTISLHRALGDQHGLVLSSLYEALFAIESGSPEEGKRELARILNDPRLRDILGLYEPQALFYLGLAHEQSGDIEEAYGLYCHAQERAIQLGHREAISLSTVGLIKTLLIMGEVEEAEKQLPLALDEAQRLGHSHASIFALAAAAVLAKFNGDPEGLRKALTLLRPYLITPHAPDMTLPRRLREMSRRVLSRSLSPRREKIAAALVSISKCLEEADREP